ncbi:MAG: DUF523 domain-containing protein [Erysipelotrichaceae bacterium]
MKIMVSACLIGRNCKYDGTNNRNENLIAFLKDHQVVCVCPEVLGGLSIPRNCCEIVDGKVLDQQGNDVSEAYQRGAEKALEIANQEAIDCAILQTRSPSCGKGFIYDGTFTGNKIKGNGVFAQLLLDQGRIVYNSDDFLKNENIKDWDCKCYQNGLK